MVNTHTAIPNTRKDERGRKARSGREGEANKKRDAVVFGDNVRARKAARALPRTPTQRGRGEGKKTRQRGQDHTPLTHRHSNPHTNHQRHFTMTQPCHKTHPLNQQCCDSRHKEGKRRIQPFTIRHHTHPHTLALQRSRLANKKGEPQYQAGGSILHPRHSSPYRPSHNTPLPPFNGDTTQTGGGHQHTDGRATITAPTLQRYATPPHHATHHPTIPPPTTTTRGEGADRGYPTTRTAQRDTHPHTTAHGNKTVA